jgi:FAD binding domain/Berberine and berberine like
MDGELELGQRGDDGQAPPRRRFLALAGAAAGAVPLAGGLAGGRHRPVAGAAARHPLAAAVPQAGPGPGDWEALRRALSTHNLVRPGQRAYPVAKELFDPRFDAKHPAGIAYCATPGDVSACIGFVRRFGLQVAARSGGHSYAGWSSVNGGLIADVTAMNSFRVSGSSVVVGAGMRLIDLYNRLAANGLAVPGGSCPTVGVAGLTLGGGVGVLSRAYGLTSDNLEAVQIVTADGQIRTCNATQDSDLFWACRGGGGGNFGIVTSFTFRTRRLSQLTLFFLRWPWSSAARVMSAWQSWAPLAPDALWSNLIMSQGMSGGAPFLQVGGTYLGSVGNCQALLNRLYAAAGSRPSSGAPFLAPYRDAMMIMAGCGSLSVSQCHLPTQTANGQLPRVPSYAKSDFFTRKIGPVGIRTLVSQIERARSVHGAAGGAGAVGFDAFGGALNRVSPSATAFVHRNALYDAQYSTSWNAGAGGAGSAAQQAWLRSCYAAMRPWASGQCYVNYLDPDLRNWQQAYYGANFARLTQVKASYDPHQVFRFPQSIPPAT